MTEDARSAKTKPKNFDALHAPRRVPFFRACARWSPRSPHALPPEHARRRLHASFRREDHPLRTPRLPVLLQNLRERLRRRARGRRVPRRRPRSASASAPSPVEQTHQHPRRRERDPPTIPTTVRSFRSRRRFVSFRVGERRRERLQRVEVRAHPRHAVPSPFERRGDRAADESSRRRADGRAPPIAARFPSGASHSRVEASRRGTSASTPSPRTVPPTERGPSARNHPPGRRTKRRVNPPRDASPDVSTPIPPRARTTRKGSNRASSRTPRRSSGAGIEAPTPNARRLAPGSTRRAPRLIARLILAGSPPRPRPRRRRRRRPRRLPRPTRVRHSPPPRCHAAASAFKRAASPTSCARCHSFIFRAAAGVLRRRRSSPARRRRRPRTRAFSRRRLARHRSSFAPRLRRGARDRRPRARQPRRRTPRRRRRYPRAKRLDRSRRAADESFGRETVRGGVARRSRERVDVRLQRRRRRRVQRRRVVVTKTKRGRRCSVSRRASPGARRDRARATQRRTNVAANESRLRVRRRGGEGKGGRGNIIIGGGRGDHHPRRHRRLDLPSSSSLLASNRASARARRSCAAKCPTKAASPSLTSFRSASSGAAFGAFERPPRVAERVRVRGVPRTDRPRPSRRRRDDTEESAPRRVRRRNSNPRTGTRGGSLRGSLRGGWIAGVAGGVALVVGASPIVLAHLHDLGGEIDPTTNPRLVRIRRGTRRPRRRRGVPPPPRPICAQRAVAISHAPSRGARSAGPSPRPPRRRPTWRLARRVVVSSSRLSWRRRRPIPSRSRHLERSHLARGASRGGEPIARGDVRGARYRSRGRALSREVRGEGSRGTRGRDVSLESMDAREARDEVASVERVTRLCGRLERGLARGDGGYSALDACFRRGAFADGVYASEKGSPASRRRARWDAASRPSRRMPSRMPSSSAMARVKSS